MKQASALVRHLPSLSDSQPPGKSLKTPDARERPCEPALIDREQIIDLWEAMGGLFGHRWTSSYGAEIDPRNLWAACLRGISREQIRAGLSAVAMSGADWPPTAPEFRKLCLGEPETGHRGELEAHRIYKPERLLEDITAREKAQAAGKSTMTDLKRMLGVSNGSDT